MIPLFYGPLKRNGYFIMDRVTWQMWQDGVDGAGRFSKEELYNYKLIIALHDVEETFINSRQVLLTIKENGKSINDSEFIGPQYPSSNEGECSLAAETN